MGRTFRRNDRFKKDRRDRNFRKSKKFKEFKKGRQKPSNAPNVLTEWPSVPEEDEQIFPHNLLN